MQFLRSAYNYVLKQSPTHECIFKNHKVYILICVYVMLVDLCAPSVRSCHYGRNYYFINYYLNNTHSLLTAYAHSNTAANQNG